MMVLKLKTSTKEEKMSKFKMKIKMINLKSKKLLMKIYLNSKRQMKKKPKHLWLKDSSKDHVPGVWVSSVFYGSSLPLYGLPLLSGRPHSLDLRPNVKYGSQHQMMFSLLLRLFLINSIKERMTLLLESDLSGEWMVLQRNISSRTNGTLSISVNFYGMTNLTLHLLPTETEWCKHVLIWMQTHLSLILHSLFAHSKSSMILLVLLLGMAILILLSMQHLRIGQRLTLMELIIPTNN